MDLQPTIYKGHWIYDVAELGAEVTCKGLLLKIEELIWRLSYLVICAVSMSVWHLLRVYQRFRSGKVTMPIRL